MNQVIGSSDPLSPSAGELPLTVTFAEAPPAARTDQIVVNPASMRSIADYAEVEQRLKAGGFTKVVIVAAPTTGLRAWAQSLVRAAPKEPVPRPGDTSPAMGELRSANLELWA
jgi:hypothetical protein